jgi:hypothetical protein
MLAWVRLKQVAAQTQQTIDEVKPKPLDDHLCQQLRHPTARMTFGEGPPWTTFLDLRKSRLIRRDFSSAPLPHFSLALHPPSPMPLTELLGYAASIIVAISLTMRSVVRLRVVNLVGALVFTLYGVLISAYPVAVLNGLIACINVYYLWQMRAQTPYFTVLSTHHDSDYLRQFLQFYAADIQNFFPNFKFEPAPNAMLFFVLRDLVPVGLFIADRHEAETLHVHLDYVIPGYRDLKPGLFLYQQEAAHFRAQGIRQLATTANTAAHRHYLRRIGFTPSPTTPDHFERAI